MNSTRLLCCFTEHIRINFPHAQAVALVCPTLNPLKRLRCGKKHRPMPNLGCRFAYRHAQTTIHIQHRPLSGIGRRIKRNIGMRNLQFLQQRIHRIHRPRHKSTSLRGTRNRRNTGERRHAFPRSVPTTARHLPNPMVIPLLQSVAIPLICHRFLTQAASNNRLSCSLQNLGTGRRIILRNMKSNLHRLNSRVFFRPRHRPQTVISNT